MKFPVKLLSILTLTGFGSVIALMWYLMLADPEPSKKLSDLRINKFASWEKAVSAMPEKPSLPRLAENKFIVQPQLDTPEEKLIVSAAGKSVLSLLPVNSFILQSHPVKLLNEHLAEVSGQAAVQSAAGEITDVWNYRVKIRFFPQGYAEAEFPEIRCSKQR